MVISCKTGPASAGSVILGLMNPLEKQESSIGMDDNIWFLDTPAPDVTTVWILHIGNVDGPDGNGIRPVA